jgi:hypothetical protein
MHEHDQPPILFLTDLHGSPDLFEAMVAEAYLLSRQHYDLEETLELKFSSTRGAGG